MATKKKIKFPKVTTGTHLTVTEYEDGRTELKWDDEQLLKEVREALASVTPASKKSKKFNYSEPKEIVTENGNKALQVTVTKKTVAKKASVSKTETDALNAYNDERLVSKHDKIQAKAGKKPASKKVVATKTTKGKTK